MKGAKAAQKGASTVRDLLNKYGFVFVGTYFTLYCTTLGTIFAGIDSGFIDPASVLDWLHSGEEAAAAAGEAGASGGSEGAIVSGVAEDEESRGMVKLLSSYLGKWEWTKPYAKTVENNPHIANLAVALLATKITEPVRLGVVLAIVPRVARYFGRVPPEATEEGSGDVVKAKN